MGAIAPIVLGVGGLLAQNEANRKAQGAADGARRSQDRLIDRQVSWYDNLFNLAEQARKDGQFDPEKQIAALEKDQARYQSRDMGNVAGAMRTAGYRPGDSEQQRHLEGVDLQYRQSLDAMRTGMRRQAFMDMIGAYSAANPSALNTGIGVQGGREQSALAQQQSPAGLFGTIMPFLNQPKKKEATFTTQPALQSAGNSAFGIDFSNPSTAMGMKWPKYGGY